MRGVMVPIVAEKQTPPAAAGVTTSEGKGKHAVAPQQPTSCCRVDDMSAMPPAKLS